LYTLQKEKLIAKILFFLITAYRWKFECLIKGWKKALPKFGQSGTSRSEVHQ